jgi:hypothetical protein
MDITVVGDLIMGLALQPLIMDLMDLVLMPPITGLMDLVL